MQDTSPESEAIQRTIWARMGPGRRLELALEMSDELRELSIDGVMARCPRLSRAEARLQVVRQILGDTLFDEAFGDHEPR